MSNEPAPKDRLLLFVMAIGLIIGLILAGVGVGR